MLQCWGEVGPLNPWTHDFINAWLGNSPGWLMALCPVMSHGSDNIAFWHCINICAVMFGVTLFFTVPGTGFSRICTALESAWKSLSFENPFSSLFKALKNSEDKARCLAILFENWDCATPMECIDGDCLFPIPSNTSLYDLAVMTLFCYS